MKKIRNNLLFLYALRKNLLYLLKSKRILRNKFVKGDVNMRENCANCQFVETRLKNPRGMTLLFFCKKQEGKEVDMLGRCDSYQCKKGE